MTNTSTSGSKLQPSMHRLNPVTSLSTLRYDRSSSVQPCPRTITRGPVCPSSVASASKWRRFVHPEGQPYFVLDGESDFTVVTEANVENTQTEERILHCVKLAQKELQCHNIEVTPRCELFLELGEDCASCNYYFVDHVGKGLFWLEDLGTELLDIPAAMSPSHLGKSVKSAAFSDTHHRTESAVERLYWVHVEFFPMHHESHEQEFSQIVDDLYDIISHGQADRLTSRTSTFPYCPDTCTQFLKLLSRKRGQRVDGYTLCYTARLAGAIMNQRFVTFYGQEFAQLDRLQQMYPADNAEHEWMSTVANLLLWGIPRYYKGLLDDLYLNEQLYADQWTQFVSLCLTDWTNSLLWTFPILISNILLANVRGGTMATTVPSVLSCAVSIVSASCLHLRHEALAEASASVGAQYLYNAKSNTVGFLPSSVVFSLPKASYLWGVSLLIAQFLFIASHSVGRLVALVAASAIATVFIFMLWVISPEEGCFTSLFQSITSLYIPRLYSSEVGEDSSMV